MPLWPMPLSASTVASWGRVAYFTWPVGALTKIVPSFATLIDGSLAMRALSTVTAGAKESALEVLEVGVVGFVPGGWTHPATSAARARTRRTLMQARAEGLFLSL